MDFKVKSLDVPVIQYVNTVFNKKPEYLTSKLANGKSKLKQTEKDLED